MSNNVHLKSAIQKKFKNINRFCKLTGLGYDKFHNMLRESNSEKLAENVKQIESLYFNTNNKALIDEIPDDVRALIKARIYQRFKNVSNFCEVSGISNMTVSLTINGQNRKITDNVKTICSMLNINLDERNK